MSVVIHKRHNLLREVGLKLHFAMKFVGDFLTRTFPGSSIGCYKTVNGDKLISRFERRSEQRSTFYALTMGPMASVFGAYMMGQNPHDPFAYIAIIVGITSSGLLVLAHRDQIEQLTKNSVNMRKEFDEKIGNMRKEFDEKIGNMRKEFDEKIGNMRKELDLHQDGNWGMENNPNSICAQNQ